MKKLLEIREYDQISCNSDYQDEYHYLPESAFHELEEFIRNYSANQGTADALEFFQISYKRYVGDVISVKNYVGLIQLKSGYQIEILPKIDFDRDDDNRFGQTKRVFLRMLRCMRDFPCKVFSEANLQIDQMTLYDIFISMFIQEVRVLVKHGLKSGYVRNEENLRYYKGRLNINEQIRQNLVHRERFFVAYDEHQLNRSENRLIKSVLLKLLKQTDNFENQKAIRQLLPSFEMIAPSSNYVKDFSQVVIDRSTKEYETAIRWCRVFLLNKSFSTFSGDMNALALLFPMDRLFEAYVARQMKVAYGERNWDISSQDKGYFLFNNPKRFALRPDIVVERRDGVKFILDTKWKKLIDNPAVNYGISQGDMYQIYAYGKKYNTANIILLYPMTREMKTHAPICFNSGDGVFVQVFFVNLEYMEESLEELKGMISEGEITHDLRVMNLRKSQPAACFRLRSMRRN